MGRRSSLAGLIGGLLWAQCACTDRCTPLAPPSIWPVRVVEYAFGGSQTFGQDSAYFPYNVLGPICTLATPTTPCADPCQVVSLGKGGHLTLEFDPPLADGPGPDFLVFENAFFYGNRQVYDEWMIVSVSQDGTSWHTFPYDSATGAGLAGRTPTGCSGCTGPINWQDPYEAGGDAFDLALVGLPWARFVRVEDATHWQSPDRLSADLDGAVAIHQRSSLASLPRQAPEPYLRNGQLYFPALPKHVQVWDLTGRSLGYRLYPTAEGWALAPQGYGLLWVEATFTPDRRYYFKLMRPFGEP